MSFSHNITNYYWPYVEGEPIEHYEHILSLDRVLTLTDGNSFYFGDLEIYTDEIDNIIEMVYYICSETPHTHSDLPSCSRLVMCFQISARNQG